MLPTAPRTRAARFLARAALLVLALSSCASTIDDKRVLQYLNQSGFGKRYTGNAQEQNYVSIGDTIQYVDTYNEEIRGSAVVDIDGTILLPEVGAVWVAGYTRTELESYLTQKLAPYFVETDVKVTIKTGGQKVLYILGEVGRRGPIRYEGDMTIFEAVIQASPSEFGANLARVRLIRPDPRDPMVLTVDLSELWISGDSTYNVQLQEYDIIYVPPTFLQSVADLISAIFVPVTSVVRDVIYTIFALEDPELFLRRGRNNQNFF
jgi:protein involved in polysaccharide export with SLBB domain